MSKQVAELLMESLKSGDSTNDRWYQEAVNLSSKAGRPVGQILWEAAKQLVDQAREGGLSPSFIVKLADQMDRIQGILVEVLGTLSSVENLPRDTHYAALMRSKELMLDAAEQFDELRASLDHQKNGKK